MQATAEGEFYPENNFARSYKIPKTELDDIPSDNKAAITGQQSTSRYNKTSQNETPLADSYYNYPYDPRAASAYYQNFRFFQDYGNLPGQGFYKPGEYNPRRGLKRPASSSGPPQRGPYNFNAPPPPPPFGDGVEPIKQNICATLKAIKEKPKKYGRNIFEQTVPDIVDDSLPKELKLLFQPLFCKLCSAQLSSNQTAKMHYKSKNHEKKIRKWLVEWSEKTGEPLPKRALGSSNKKDEESEKNPAWFHCDVCDLELTGQMHAESHYMGRNHQKAILGHKAPAGQGYYDKDGKWVRVKGQKSKCYDFEKGEDNFGMDFKSSVREQSAEESVKSGEPPAKKKKEAAPPLKFHCEVCDVNTTCQEQLDTHFRGQKHVKKLKLLGLDNPTEHRKLVEPTASVVAPPTPSITDSPIDPDLNLAVYRTPSGDYYCPTCNLTTNSEPQFIQHMKSKGHARKASQKKSKLSN